VAGLAVAAPSAASRSGVAKPKNLAFPLGRWTGTGVKNGAPFKAPAPLAFKLTAKQDGSVDGEFEIGGPLATTHTAQGVTSKLRLEVTGKLGGNARAVAILGLDSLKGTITARLENPITHKRTYHTVPFETSLPLRSLLIADTANCQKVTGRAYFRFGPVKFTAVRQAGSKPETLPQSELLDRYAALLAAFRDAKNPQAGKTDVEDLIDKTQDFLVVLAQANACGKVPAGFEKGLPGADELVASIDWMVGIMLLSGVDHPSLELIQKTAKSFATQTWIQLLDLAEEARIANGSAPAGSDAQNFWQRFRIILDYKLQAAIDAGNKAEIAQIYDAATRAGMTTLATKAKKALQ
jgi:hypothetical protein